MPYLVFEDLFICLCSTLGLAVTIVVAFNYYVAVAKDLSFKGQFFEMTGLSFAVAAVSFLIGCCLRAFLGLDLWPQFAARVYDPVADSGRVFVLNRLV